MAWTAAIWTLLAASALAPVLGVLFVLFEVFLQPDVHPLETRWLLCCSPLAAASLTTLYHVSRLPSKANLPLAFKLQHWALILLSALLPILFSILPAIVRDTYSHTSAAAVTVVFFNAFLSPCIFVGCALAAVLMSLEVTNFRILADADALLPAIDTLTCYEMQWMLESVQHIKQCIASKVSSTWNLPICLHLLFTVGCSVAVYSYAAAQVAGRSFPPASLAWVLLATLLSMSCDVALYLAARPLCLKAAELRAKLDERSRRPNGGMPDTPTTPAASQLAACRRELAEFGVQIGPPFQQVAFGKDKVIATLLLSLPVPIGWAFAALPSLA